MEKWESYYHQWGTYPATYAGASHVRYPVPADGQYDTPYRGSVFTSASGEGAQAWSSPTSSQHVDPEEELITYGKLPISLEDDPDPQVRHTSLYGNN